VPDPDIMLHGIHLQHLPLVGNSSMRTFRARSSMV
jgi:hypothetical protein